MKNTQTRAVLPSKREKKRYLAFEISSESRISDIKAVSAEILKAISSFLGSAKTNLKVFTDIWSPQKQRGIIRIGHKYVEQLKQALTRIKDLAGQKVTIKSVGLSGTIKKAKMRYLA